MKNFGVGIEFVTQNPVLKDKLKIWNSRRVAASFNPTNGIMYLRHEVTAYTVQHEMYHMQLWYKMTKELPEMSELYAKTVGVKLFHEEYVLAQFMKKPNLWEASDLLNDLETINKLRLEKGLEAVSLEYYKSWKLEVELSNF